MLARVRVEHRWATIGRCSCGVRWPDDEPAGFAWMDRHRDEARFAALREAGLIPEATTRVEWGVIGISSFGYQFGPTTEENARHIARIQGATVAQRTVTEWVPADHVTEWEPAE